MHTLCYCISIYQHACELWINFYTSLHQAGPSVVMQPRMQLPILLSLGALLSMLHLLRLCQWHARACPPLSVSVESTRVICIICCHGHRAAELGEKSRRMWNERKGAGKLIPCRSGSCRQCGGTVLRSRCYRQCLQVVVLSRLLYFPLTLYVLFKFDLTFFFH